MRFGCLFRDIMYNHISFSYLIIVIFFYMEVFTQMQRWPGKAWPKFWLQNMQHFRLLQRQANFSVTDSTCIYKNLFHQSNLWQLVVSFVMLWKQKQNSQAKSVLLHITDQSNYISVICQHDYSSVFSSFYAT